MRSLARLPAVKPRSLSVVPSALLTLLLLLCSGGVAGATPLITNGLVAAYLFDGNADDWSGNGNNGVVNGATLTADRFGNPNSAYSFDGSNQTITVAEVDGFERDSLAVSLWLRAGAFSANGIRSDLLGKDGLQRQWVLQLEDSGRVRGAVFTSSGEQVFDSQAAISANAWHHLAYVWDGSSASIFIDGSFDSSISTSGSLASGNEPLSLGSNPPWFTNFFTGSIDEVYIYDRALSASEVQTLFSSVPEPATSLLMGIGLIGLSTSTGRRASR